jgi:hypothetical protein
MLATPNPPLFAPLEELVGTGVVAVPGPGVADELGMEQVRIAQQPDEHNTHIEDEVPT